MSTLKLPISGFVLEQAHANIDTLWGPYNSLPLALEAIPVSKRKAGFKFGVTSDNTIIEYTFETDGATTATECVSKKSDYYSKNDIDGKVGNMQNLSTTEKNSLVGSINELKQGLDDKASTSSLTEGLSGKQGTINDLDAIRSGAGKGATSVQGVKMEGDDEPLTPGEDGVVTIPQPEIPDAVTSVLVNNELVFQTPDGQSVKGKVGITTGADGLLHMTLTDEEGHTYSSPIAGLRVDGNALQYSNDGETWTTVQTFGKLAIKYAQASDPSSGDVGDLALVGTTNAYVLKVYVGGSWVSVCDFGTLNLTSDGIIIAGENKTLTEKLAEVDASITRDEILDLTNYNSLGITTTSSKTFSTYNASSKGIVINVQEGEVYSLVPQNGKLIFLLTNSFVFFSGFSFASAIAQGYTDRVNENRTDPLEVVIPSGCKYMFLHCSSSLGDITPTVIRKVGIKNIVSDDIFKSSHLLSSDELVSAKEISNFQLTASMQWQSFNSSENIRHSAVYDVSEIDRLHLHNRNSVNTWYAFLDKLSNYPGESIEDSRLSVPTSGRFILSPGGDADLVVPSGSNYLYVTTEVNGQYQRPTIKTYIPISEASGNNGASDGNVIEIAGNRDTPVRKAIFSEKPKAGVYRITFAGGWNVSSYTASTSICLSINLRDVNDTDLRTIYKVLKGDKTNINIKEPIYFSIDDDAVENVSISIRADMGEVVSASIEEVTQKYRHKVCDVSFVDETTVLRSFMFKLNAGQLLRYSVSANANDVFFTSYTRNRTDDANLKKDELTASENGTQTGFYCTGEDCFVEMTSLSNSTPSCCVYEAGEDAGVKVTYPFQLKFDTDNMEDVLTPDDDDATSYDNDRCAAGSILQVSDTLYYMLYHARGSYDNGVPFSLCIAHLDLTEQNPKWTRGFPRSYQGTKPHPDSNVLIMREDPCIKDIHVDTREIDGELKDIAKSYINEFAVCKIDNDRDFPYRMIAQVRNPDDVQNGLTTAKLCLLKSTDAINWILVRKVCDTVHDCYSSMIYDNGLINVYLRMWDYEITEKAKQRLIGYMTIDIHGNMVVPPTGLFGNGLYQPSATYVGQNRTLMLPSHFYTTDNVHGDSALEAYMLVGDNVLNVPTYHINGLTNSADGWRIIRGLFNINNKLYCLYTQFTKKHGEDGNKAKLVLCPVSWVTYNTGNSAGPNSNEQ